MTQSEWLESLLLNLTGEAERMLETTTSAPILGAIKELQVAGRFGPRDEREISEERKHLLACIQLAMNENASRRDARIATSGAVSVAFILGLYCGERAPEVAAEIVKSMGAQAGRKSGEARRRKAGEWRPYVAGRVRKIRENLPGIKKAALIAEIHEEWDPSIRKKPIGERTLSGFITELDNREWQAR
jgi:hypothetical protein